MDEDAARHQIGRVARAWRRLRIATERVASTRGRIGRGETRAVEDDIEALLWARLANSLQALKDLDDRTDRVLLPALEPLIASAGRDIPDWRRLIRMRDRLVHRWHDVDPRRVRQVVNDVHPTLEWMAEAVRVHPEPVEDPSSVLEAELAAEVECVVFTDLTGRLGVAILGDGPDSRRIRELRWAQRS